MESNDPIVIVAFARTPIGKFLGGLQSFTAPQLGEAVIRAVVTRSRFPKEQIDEVLMGCVLPAGLGQAPARQAAILAGLSVNTPCTTINKVCGSGMKAVMIAHDELLVGSVHAAIAGGMESMTNAPYLLKKARQGYRLGKGELYDHMMLDGLEDAYDVGRPMGYFAEECVRKYRFTRTQQDDYALRSFACAIKANEGTFAQEIIPLTVKTKQGDVTIAKDEHPFAVVPKKIPELAPAFLKEGTITPGNTSAIADGAAALMLMRQSKAKAHGITPIATIMGHASAAKASNEFTTAPIDATQKLLKHLKWSTDSVDLYEVNEAFAVVALAFMHDLKIPLEKINIHGGGCALGHPIGSTGARIIVTLINALRTYHLKRGIATLCIGGGEATAIGIEISTEG